MHLAQSFYLREDVVELARDLLGKTIVVRNDNEPYHMRIVETEAYAAPEDKASHAYHMKKTARTATMYRAGGVSYVYLCYGIHHLFNLVTGPAGLPHAVLIRAVEPLTDASKIILKKDMKTNGPGKWTKHCGITRDHNGLSCYDPKGVIHLLDAPAIPADRIIESPRVGVAYAEDCAHWPYRFRIAESAFTSLPHHVQYESHE